MAGGRKVRVTAAPEHVLTAEHIVLPGVGAFGDCAAGLRAIDGMIEALEIRVRRDGRPFLGICVGMHLMCRIGLEHGMHRGLGWIDGEVAPLNVPAGLKVPHMGWNNLQLATAHPVMQGLDGAHAYFVHGFAVQPSVVGDVVATTDYGRRVVAAMARDNICGTQFHPEKSQQTGMQLIANFLDWKP